MTLSLTINETLKRLSSLPIFMQVILVVTVSLPPTSIPLPSFSPSLISLMVSVDVKHHVYLLTVPVPNKPPHLCGRKAECLLSAVIKLRDATLTYVTDVRAAVMTSRQQCLLAVKGKNCGKRISANVDKTNYWHDDRL